MDELVFVALMVRDASSYFAKSSKQMKEVDRSFRTISDDDGSLFLSVPINANY
jgi:hypothetical protein